MRIVLRAGGILRQGPERELTSDYIQRAQGLARATGFLGVEEDGVDLRGCSNRTQETQKLLAGVPDDAHLIILDERGKTPTSRVISKSLAGWRDDGRTATYWMIGGADGFDPHVLKKRSGTITRWAFGTQTWPHKLVRVMASEQIYRALSILAGSPYHRD